LASCLIARNLQAVAGMAISLQCARLPSECVT